MARDYLYLLDAEWHIKAREIPTTATKRRLSARRKLSCVTTHPSQQSSVG